MVSNMGVMLANGYQPVHHRKPMHHRGNGTVRKIAGNVLGSLGHMLITRVANAISGSGRKRTYRKRRTTHTVRGSSWKVVGTGQRTYRQTTIVTTRKHHKVGGYKRVGRPKTRKTRRISTVRRTRRILII